MVTKKYIYMVVELENGGICNIRKEIEIMPLYDFKCESCDYIEEVLTSSAGSAEIILTCPECEKETMRRQIGLSSFQLKGGGWYKDGYTKKPKVEKE